MKLNIKSKKQSMTKQPTQPMIKTIMSPHRYLVKPLSYCLTAFVLVNATILPANAIILDRSSTRVAPHKTINNKTFNNKTFNSKTTNHTNTSHANYGTKSTIVNNNNYIRSVNKDSNKDSVKYIKNYKTYSPPSTMYSNAGNNNISINSNSNGQKKLDSMGNLIQQKNREYEKTADAFYKSQTNAYNPNTGYTNQNYNTYNNNSSNYSSSYSSTYSSNNGTSWKTNLDFDSWLTKFNNRQQADEYRYYLQQRLGAVPPMSQLLRTARSWSTCGASPYEVPPRYLWDNMVSTLRLYAELKRQGILPYSTVIRSVYRNPSLNQCANGARGSKHKVNSAMDLWVPSFDYDIWQKHDVQDRLCQFWLYQGESYNFGLGIYSTGAIHIDTEGYRKWGSKYTPKHSACRF